MEFGRKLYSLGEIYTILYKGIRTAPLMSKARRKGEMSSEFMERIMLAVTEVNGCPLCSYAHTKMALEAGMSNEEIHNMLSGVMEDVPEDELQAVMFAQHYADSRGKPSKESWDRVVHSYGKIKSQGILGAIRAIMMGNALGIPWGSFLNRFKGKPDERSSLGYELAVIVVGSLMVPIAMVHALIGSILNKRDD
ncbi:carboxymuconolactone decarboxylase family protein [Gudongella sp. SC589]|jgi:AhpD family alkylhydroperoxidase|uniref:carboxymuconolactone decarboxylase family protein n=1 Tax=Gudongella sp. SC589 TaxID=3385990 RepID=UPI0039049318